MTKNKTKVLAKINNYQLTYHLFNLKEFAMSFLRLFNPTLNNFTQTHETPHSFCFISHEHCNNL